MMTKNPTYEAQCTHVSQDAGLEQKVSFIAAHNAIDSRATSKRIPESDDTHTSPNPYDIPNTVADLYQIPVAETSQGSGLDLDTTYDRLIDVKDSNLVCDPSYDTLDRSISQNRYNILNTPSDKQTVYSSLQRGKDAPSGGSTNDTMKRPQDKNISIDSSTYDSIASVSVQNPYESAFVEYSSIDRDPVIENGTDHVYDEVGNRQDVNVALLYSIPSNSRSRDSGGEFEDFEL
eukprot:UC4_evm1s1309